MAEWNASAELMAQIQASIKPIQTDDPLQQVLMRHFSTDFPNLPISGGWGYTQADAIIFVRSQFPIPAFVPRFVSLEYQIVQKIIYEELIIFRAKDSQFSGIDKKCNRSILIDDGVRVYDLLEFDITCWSDWHWDLLKQEWEENNFGMRPGFDREAHAAKRDASQIRYERKFWFNITDVFDR